jgi:hypothetical protein
MYVGVALVIFSASLFGAGDAPVVPDILVEILSVPDQYDVLCTVALKETVSIECLGIEMKSEMLDATEETMKAGIETILQGIINSKKSSIDQQIPFESADLF